MSKLVFLLCTFLIAGAVYADDTEAWIRSEEVTLSLVDDIKSKLIYLINGAIKQVKDTLEYVLNAVSNNLQKIKNEASKIAHKVEEDITILQERIMINLKKILSGAIDVNVEKCSKMVDTFNQTFAEALSEVSHCLNNIVDEANNYIDQITIDSSNILQNLTAIREEAKVCIQDVDGVSAAKALRCVTAAAFKGALLVTKDVPHLILEMGRLSEKVTTLLPRLAFCSTVQGVKDVYKHSSEIVEDVGNCIKAHKVTIN